MYFCHFSGCLRAAQMYLAGHMRPASRVFETPGLEHYWKQICPVHNWCTFELIIWKNIFFLFLSIKCILRIFDNKKLWGELRCRYCFIFSWIIFKKFKYYVFELLNITVLLLAFFHLSFDIIANLELNQFVKEKYENITIARGKRTTITSNALWNTHFGFKKKTLHDFQKVNVRYDRYNHDHLFTWFVQCASRTCFWLFKLVTIFTTVPAASKTNSLQIIFNSELVAWIRSSLLVKIQWKQHHIYT